MKRLHSSLVESSTPTHPPPPPPTEFMDITLDVIIHEIIPKLDKFDQYCVSQSSKLLHHCVLMFDLSSNKNENKTHKHDFRFFDSVSVSQLDWIYHENMFNTTEVLARMEYIAAVRGHVDIFEFLKSINVLINLAAAHGHSVRHDHLALYKWIADNYADTTHSFNVKGVVGPLGRLCAAALAGAHTIFEYEKSKTNLRDLDCGHMVEDALNGKNIHIIECVLQHVDPTIYQSWRYVDDWDTLALSTLDIEIINIYNKWANVVWDHDHLIYVAAHGNVDVFEWLFEHMDVDEFRGSDAVHVAAYNDNWDAVWWLIEKECNADEEYIMDTIHESFSYEQLSAFAWFISADDYTDGLCTYLIRRNVDAWKEPMEWLCENNKCPWRHSYTTQVCPTTGRVFEHRHLK